MGGGRRRNPMLGLECIVLLGMLLHKAKSRVKMISATTQSSIHYLRTLASRGTVDALDAKMPPTSR